MGLYFTVLYCTVLYCTILYCTIPDDVPSSRYLLLSQLLHGKLFLHITRGLLLRVCGENETQLHTLTLTLQLDTPGLVDIAGSHLVEDLVLVVGGALGSEYDRDG